MQSFQLRIRLNFGENFNVDEIFIINVDCVFESINLFLLKKRSVVCTQKDFSSNEFFCKFFVHYYCTLIQITLNLITMNKV